MKYGEAQFRQHVLNDMVEMHVLFGVHLFVGFWQGILVLSCHLYVV